MTTPTHAPHSRRLLTRAAATAAVVLLPGAVLASCGEDTPTSAAASPGTAAPAAVAAVARPQPIATELLTQRHEFTDDVAVQVRLKPQGRARTVVNMQDASRMAVARFTIQPGVRFPWHTHPGLVMVAVTKGELVFVYGDDCVERRYQEGTAFVDPGFGNVHYAYNPSGGELVIVATFLGVPAPPTALTAPVSPQDAAAYDTKCGAVSASSHHH